MSSSLVAFVRVVTSARSPRATQVRSSSTRSATWPFRGRTSISGSTSPVGRMICSTTPFEIFRSNGPGVAETKTSSGTRARNSGNFRGRLSRQEGSRQPNSTRLSLRLRSPLYIPWSWGTVTWDSSRNAEEVLREEIEQRVRRLAGTATGEVPGVVLDAGAVAGLPDHLEIVLGPALEPLGLHDLLGLLELGDAALLLRVDLLEDPLEPLVDGEEVRGGEDEQVRRPHGPRRGSSCRAPRCSRRCSPRARSGGGSRPSRPGRGSRRGPRNRPRLSSMSFRWYFIRTSWSMSSLRLDRLALVELARTLAR